MKLRFARTLLHGLGTLFLLTACSTPEPSKVNYKNDEPITFEGVMAQLDPLVDKFDQMRITLPPEKKRELGRVSMIEFRKQSEFIENELNLSPKALDEAHVLAQWVKGTMEHLHDPKERKAAHNEYNRKLFDLFGPEKFKRYSDFKVGRFKELVRKFEPGN